MDLLSSLFVFKASAPVGSSFVAVIASVAHAASRDFQTIYSHFKTRAPYRGCFSIIMPFLHTSFTFGAYREG